MANEWQVMQTNRFSSRRYNAPVVSVTWYNLKSKKNYVASFNFSAKAIETLGYDKERWCIVEKGNGKLRFSFMKEKKTNTRSATTSSGQVQVRLYNPDLKGLTPGKAATFLLNVEEDKDKKGWIDLTKPIDPEKYLE